MTARGAILSLFYYLAFLPGESHKKSGDSQNAVPAFIFDKHLTLAISHR